MKRFLLTLIGAIIAIFSQAQSISVSVPAQVSAGENFRISYTVNTQDVEGFRIGGFPAGLEVVAGPYTSRQSSFQMINGHTSSSSSITFTYTLYAERTGSYVIPSAHVKVGDKSISSRTEKIRVVGAARASRSSAPPMHEDDGESQMRSAGSRISGNDLFIKVSANKKRVHEQEPILLTYKVYTLVDLTQLEGKMPDLTGFHTQEVQLPQQKSFHVERVNGRNYRCVTWSQYVMYPQMTGKLAIPSITFKGIVVQQNRSVDPFEAFFNGGSGYVEVKRNIQAPGVSIYVDPLPKRPSDFSGGVGHFNISAQIDHDKVKAGDPISLRVVVGGIGNLKLIKQPEVNFPKDFDKYDPKVTDKTRLTANGVEGNMIYDILAVPRHQGVYTIPPVSFTYYDTSANAYKTIKTQSFTIHVAAGKDNASSVDKFTEERDIRPIMKGETSQHSVDDFFFGCANYLISLLIPIIAFITLLIVFRKRAINNANIVKMRGMKANKIATKRLKKAYKLMLQGKQNEFYDEVLRTLWGYVGDKLNIPVEKLSRENISEKLADNQIDEETINKFISAIDECEFERYAPGDVIGNMNKTFEMAKTAIMKIEDVMTNKKKYRKSKAGAMQMVLLLIMMLFMHSYSMHAITKADADAEYMKGNYQQAISDYQELLRSGVSAELYYNLGNAYYRSDNITQAILGYERALMLAPGNNDIRFNLQFARMKTIDKIAPQGEMFFVTWYHSLVNMASVDQWAVLAVISIIVALVFVLLYLFAPRIILRKIGFYGASVLILLFIFSNLFAYQQKQNIENRVGAIVIASSVTVKDTPSMTSKDKFVLHEGTRVDMTDKSMKGWRGIKLSDGREGWLQTNQIEEI